jgi:hypothetical protein
MKINIRPIVAQFSKLQHSALTFVPMYPLLPYVEGTPKTLVTLDT